ncbi:MAG TPA: dihydrofolate reductase family protein [Citricoccus sp.]
MSPGRHFRPSRVRVHNFAVSRDGVAAGFHQSRERPFGDLDPTPLMSWAGATDSWPNRAEPGGSRGVDDHFVRDFTHHIGAEIMGRNKFAPIRGPWPDEEWRGWWGDDPPFRTPVFVLTHHPRPSIQMDGGTSFHFVNSGIEAALKQALAAAEGADVRIGGGASTVQQYLRAGLVDELHVAVVPVLLGDGERLFDNLDDVTHGLECAEVASSGSVAHVRMVRAT